MEPGFSPGRPPPKPSSMARCFAGLKPGASTAPISNLATTNKVPLALPMYSAAFPLLTKLGPLRIIRSRCRF